jgi:hypothetical protein
LRSYNPLASASRRGIKPAEIKKSQLFTCVDALEFKMTIIRKYEVRFSRLPQCRFKLSALYDLETILHQTKYDARPKKRIDPTVHDRPLTG